VGFELFIKERQYLQNVSPRTIQWYEENFKWLGNPSPDEAELKAFVLRMPERGLKPSSCNNRIRAVNAYLKWSGSPLQAPRLKEEQRVLSTFSFADLSRLAAWKPKRFYEHRLHTLIVTLADTGCRINEILSLRWVDCDFDNLLLTVKGKGGKERKVRVSFELRRSPWKYQQRKNRGELVFATRDGRKLGRRDVLRDVKSLSYKLGIRVPGRTLHAFMHTFAINYLRSGGSVFHLQKALGHSSLDMTRMYVNLLTEDLQQVHQKVSVLSAAMS
jgi:integrase/recombinase XerD